MFILWLLLLGVMIEDLWRMTISNWTVLGVLIVGMVFRFSRLEFKAWVVGTLVAVAFSLIFYLIGGLGGGDAKLLMALGGIFLPFTWLLMLTLACVITAVWFFVWRITQRKAESFNNENGVDGQMGTPYMKAEIPFGPAIAIAVLLIQSGLVNRVIETGGI